MGAIMPIPFRDVGALAILAAHLRDSALTIDEISEKMNISERTGYRWLRYLEAEGFVILVKRSKKSPGKLAYMVENS